MKNISLNTKNPYILYHKLYMIIAPILCLIFIGIAAFASSKENGYKIKTNKLSTEIENLKTIENNLNKTNKNLLDSSLNLDALLNQISQVNN